jgi:hypothetical protein
MMDLAPGGPGLICWSITGLLRITTDYPPPNREPPIRLRRNTGASPVF